MAYQESFPTIWDTPSKPSTKPRASTPKSATTPPVGEALKEAIWSIWDTPKGAA
ncbi:hypothetical protein [Vreelandella massiliensis]|uniref:hypothetical protein n=1 Tax=Vreelandella massiliensis TaxID=1816686 RepID=UPI0013564B13|nr:hypothetical protein [Halomonas massiliensis]MYL23907.1 hypothetical protein [Halomonas alkaliantarctica]